MVVIPLWILVTLNIEAKCPMWGSGRIILCEIKVQDWTVIHGMLITV